MESSILQKIGIDPAYILIGMLVLIIALFVLLFILMGNIKNRNKQIKRLLSGTQAGDLEDIIMKRFAINIFFVFTRSFSFNHSLIIIAIASEIKQNTMVSYVYVTARKRAVGVREINVNARFPIGIIRIAKNITIIYVINSANLPAKKI